MIMMRCSTKPARAGHAHHLFVVDREAMCVDVFHRKAEAWHVAV